MANWFVAIPALEARGRLPLVDGRVETVQALAQDGLKRLSGIAPSAAKPALLATWRAKAILKRAANRPERVARGELLNNKFQQRINLFRQTL